MRLNIDRQEVCATCGGSGAAKGANTTVCPECNGSGNVTQVAGAMRFSLTCPRCQGTGRLRNHVPHLSRRRADFAPTKPWMCGFLRGRSRARGCAWPARATREPWARRPGDLYITVRVDPHPFFRREGDDIEITVPVRIDEAGLGTKIEVPTIDGRALLKIPQGTKNGQKFRLREKGVLNSRTGKRGDQIVEVQIDAPVVHDERTKELLREYAKLHPEDPRGEIWAKV